MIMYIEWGVTTKNLNPDLIFLYTFSADFVALIFLQKVYIHKFNLISV